MQFSTSELAVKITKRRIAYERMQGQRTALEQQQKQLEEQIRNLETKGLLYDKALVVLHSMSVSVHDGVVAGLQDLVTAGLQSVFGPTVKFKIELSKRAQQVVVDFLVEDEEGHRYDPLDSRGGGLASVVGVVLRIVILRLLVGQRRQVLILDEPLAHLSAEYIEPAAQMLATLAERLDIQIVMVTHEETFMEYADRAYRLTKRSDKVVAEKVK